METNLQQHIIEWLDSIGADGLMKVRIGEDRDVILTKDLEKACKERGMVIAVDRVPAFRHADGTYHTEPEPCFNCERGHRPECMTPDVPCYWYQSWLSHKGEEK